MRRLGKLDARPWLERIRNAEFEIVLNDRNARPFRGMRGLDDPDFKNAISATYKLNCTVFGKEILLPRNRPRDEVLAGRLRKIGCVPE
jgi:hypothetical protein